MSKFIDTRDTTGDLRELTAPVMNTSARQKFPDHVNRVLNWWSMRNLFRYYSQGDTTLYHARAPREVVIDKLSAQFGGDCLCVVEANPVSDREGPFPNAAVTALMNPRDLDLDTSPHLAYRYENPRDEAEHAPVHAVEQIINEDIVRNNTGLRLIFVDNGFFGLDDNQRMALLQLYGQLLAPDGTMIFLSDGVDDLQKKYQGKDESNQLVAGHSVIKDFVAAGTTEEAKSRIVYLPGLRHRMRCITATAQKSKWSKLAKAEKRKITAEYMFDNFADAIGAFPLEECLVTEREARGNTLQRQGTIYSLSKSTLNMPSIQRKGKEMKKDERGGSLKSGSKRRSGRRKR